MKIMFLGTGAMVPTKQRNVSSVLLSFEGEFLLFDCGEGTQRQMSFAGLSKIKVTKVLITHWHGDHVAGLIGLIQSVGHVENPGELMIIGPKGSKTHLFHLLKSMVFDKRISLNVQEVDPEGVEVVLDEKKYQLLVAPMKHGVPTLGFSFVEKPYRRVDLVKARKVGLSQGPLLGRLTRGESVEFSNKIIRPEDVTYVQEGRKVTYIMDTAYVPEAVSLAENSDLLVCESTFLSSEQQKANDYYHLSAKQAAMIAKQAGVKQLVLTHFSQRYPVVDPLVDEASEVFPNTIAAHDFLELSVDRKKN